MKIAITGASGSIYARLTIEALLRAPEVEQIALIMPIISLSTVWRIIRNI